MENKKLKFDEKRLFNFIKEQAKIIKEQSFDVTQINRTANNYLTLLYTWERYNKKIKDLKLVEKGDKIVLVAGTKVGKSGDTNTIKVVKF